MPHSGYKSVAYFTNWGIYGRGYTPDKIPIDQFTHILYSFGDNGEDGTVRLTDSWADEQIHWAQLGDSWNEQGNNLYGCLKQLNLAKKRNRNLKLMLSIGGWTYTNEQKHFDTPASTEAGRKQFAKSCVDLIKNYGFDGIDLDWEYPQNETQGRQLLALLKEIRVAMDNYARSLTQYGNQPHHFELSIAAPAGKSNYKNLPLRELSQNLDFINIMGYDFSGAWDKVSGHQANLYKSKSCPSCTPFAMDDVVNDYIGAGVSPEKIVYGMPLYGRAFADTDGFGKPYSGVGPGSWENGIWDFKVLPQPGAKEYYDKESGASYSYDNNSRTLISYDTVGSAITKTQYLQSKGLGGAMWWELSGDKPNVQDSIVHNVSHPSLHPS
jgi:chitinase